MSLWGIRALNAATATLFYFSFLVMFGGSALDVYMEWNVMGLFLLLGLLLLIVSFGLCIVVDHAKCPKCGKTFSRQSYSEADWYRYTRTQICWTCVHCGYGSE